MEALLPKCLRDGGGIWVTIQFPPGLRNFVGVLQSARSHALDFGNLDDSGLPVT